MSHTIMNGDLDIYKSLFFIALSAVLGMSVWVFVTHVNAQNDVNNKVETRITKLEDLYRTNVEVQTQTATLLTEINRRLQKIESNQ